MVGKFPGYLCPFLSVSFRHRINQTVPLGRQWSQSAAPRSWQETPYPNSGAITYPTAIRTAPPISDFSAMGLHDRRVPGTLMIANMSSDGKTISAPTMMRERDTIKAGLAATTFGPGRAKSRWRKGYTCDNR